MIHKAHHRGHADYGWLKANYSFSFAQYWNPKRTHFGKLLVLNDDQISPREGFPTHGHKDMEIITIPLAGELHHKDSMGKEEVLGTGEVQVMSAGSGVTHSEYNASEVQELQLFQIWIHPHTLNLTPRYEQKRFTEAYFDNQWGCLVSRDGREASLAIAQNAEIYRGQFAANQSIHFTNTPGMGIFLMVITGSCQYGNQILNQRDSLELESSDLELIIQTFSDLLLIHVPLE